MADVINSAPVLCGMAHFGSDLNIKQKLSLYEFVAMTGFWDLVPPLLQLGEKSAANGYLGVSKSVCFNGMPQTYIKIWRAAVRLWDRALICVDTALSFCQSLFTLWLKKFFLMHDTHSVTATFCISQGNVLVLPAHRNVNRRVAL